MWYLYLKLSWSKKEDVDEVDVFTMNVVGLLIYAICGKPVTQRRDES
jgi:hypothetical protein